MTVLEFVARTFSPQLPDGRYIFRPWGAWGSCYLLSARQRATRAWFQLGFYTVALATLWLYPVITVQTSNLVIFAVAFACFNYALFWFFSIGLSVTEKPLRQTAEQRRTAMAAHSRSIGRPVLRVLLIISCLFAFAGGAMALFLDEWATGMVCLFFFGTCTATFAWQLSLVGPGTNT